MLPAITWVAKPIERGRSRQCLPTCGEHPCVL